MLQWLYHIDVTILLAINRHYNLTLDKIMWFASGTASWIPFYALLIALLIIVYKKDSWLKIALVGPMIVLTDQTASGIIKPLVARLRPSHQPGLQQILHYVNGYQGGSYGFLSSHACNVFALSLYLTLVASKRLPWLPYLMFPWACFVAYSRIYLAVHYPSDVLAGAVLGMTIAWLMARLYAKLYRLQRVKKKSRTVAANQKI